VSTALPDEENSLDEEDVLDQEDVLDESLLQDMDNDESWEEELESVIQGAGPVKDWKTLREQIKTELRKTKKGLPLSQVNQLMILANFATLRLKGFSRTDASLQIANQWWDGKGIWFARRIRALARH
jgi:hypothetical protein